MSRLGQSCGAASGSAGSMPCRRPITRRPADDSTPNGASAFTSRSLTAGSCGSVERPVLGLLQHLRDQLARRVQEGVVDVVDGDPAAGRLLGEVAQGVEVAGVLLVRRGTGGDVVARLLRDREPVRGLGQQRLRSPGLVDLARADRAGQPRAEQPDRERRGTGIGLAQRAGQRGGAGGVVDGQPVRGRSEHRQAFGVGGRQAPVPQPAAGGEAQAERATRARASICRCPTGGPPSRRSAPAGRSPPAARRRR